MNLLCCCGSGSWLILYLHGPLLLFHSFEPDDERESRAQVDGGEDEEKSIRQRPLHAKSLTRPEGAKGRQHDPDDELQRVFRHVRQWYARKSTYQDDQDTCKERAERGRSNSAGARDRACCRTHPEGDHNERHFESFE